MLLPAQFKAVFIELPSRTSIDIIMLRQRANRDGYHWCADCLPSTRGRMATKCVCRMTRGNATPSVDAKTWGLKHAPYKMLLAVNQSLLDPDGKPTKMKPGKVRTQRLRDERVFM